MAGLTAPAVLGTAAGLPALPLAIIPLYFELDGSFPNHEANPLDPANLVDISRAVVEHGADIGLAFDGDADRCFVVDEKGEPVPASVITLLVGQRELNKVRRAAGLDYHPGPKDVGNPVGLGGENAPTIVHNLITSRAVPEMLAADGAKIIRTRVGHSFIKAEMAQAGAIFGGEHSGHFYFKDFWFADSGMLAALHVLAALGTGKKAPLSMVNEWYQPYVQSGEINSRVSDVAAVRTSVVEAYTHAHPEAEVDNLDGVTVAYWPSREASPSKSAESDAPRWWFNLRGSNTEPLLRLNVEAENRATMEKVRDEVLNLISELGG
jgi:phosphomannomutase